MPPAAGARRQPVRWWPATVTPGPRSNERGGPPPCRILGIGSVGAARAGRRFRCGYGGRAGHFCHRRDRLAGIGGPCLVGGTGAKAWRRRCRRPPMVMWLNCWRGAHHRAQTALLVQRRIDACAVLPPGGGTPGAARRRWPQRRGQGHPGGARRSRCRWRTSNSGAPACLTATAPASALSAAVCWVRNCAFIDNENGILTNNVPDDTELTVEDSEFGQAPAGHAAAAFDLCGAHRAFCAAGQPPVGRADGAPGEVARAGQRGALQPPR